MHFFSGSSLKNDSALITGFFHKQGFEPSLISRPMIDVRNGVIARNEFPANGSMHFRKIELEKAAPFPGVYEVSIFWGENGAKGAAFVAGLFRVEHEGLNCPVKPHVMPYEAFRKLMSEPGEEPMQNYLQVLRGNFLEAPFPPNRRDGIKQAAVCAR